MSGPGVCPICTTPDQACGDDHVQTVITSDTLRGGTVSDQPQELSEYEYWVGHARMTAQLSKEHAEAIGAKPVGSGETPGETDKIDNKESERLGTRHEQGDRNGTVGDAADPDALNKARSARNRRSGN